MLRRHDSGDQVEDARVTGALSQLELDHVRWAADRGWATVNAVADDRARC